MLLAEHQASNSVSVPDGTGAKLPDALLRLVV
jgi:hypothetical protein